MKKYFLVLFSAVTLSVAVHAQDSTITRHHNREAKAIKQHRMGIMEQLNLTDDQKAKMQKLRGEQRVKLDSIRNSSVSEDEKMAQMKALRESQRKSMEELLTPEQRSKMQEMRSQQMEKRKAQRESADSTK